MMQLKVTMMLSLLLAPSDALHVDEPKPVMKLRGGVTGIDPTNLAKYAYGRLNYRPTASHRFPVSNKCRCGANPTELVGLRLGLG